MAASGQQVVEGDDERGGFQVTAAVTCQISGKKVLHIAQVHAEEVQVIFANLTHQLVHLACPQHGVVSLSVSYAYTTGIGEKLGQLLELVFAQAVQHALQFIQVFADARLGVAVYILIDKVDVFFGIGHVVVLLVLPQLLVHVVFDIVLETALRQRVRQTGNLVSTQVLEDGEQVAGGLV